MLRPLRGVASDWTQPELGATVDRPRDMLASADGPDRQAMVIDALLHP